MSHYSFCNCTLVAVHVHCGLSVPVNHRYSLLHALLGDALCSIIITPLDSRSIIESVDSISKDERGFPLTQYITNGRISRDGYTFTHFKHHHRVLRLISYSMSV